MKRSEDMTTPLLRRLCEFSLMLAARLAAAQRSRDLEACGRAFLADLAIAAEPTPYAREIAALRATFLTLADGDSATTRALRDPPQPGRRR